jgi:5'-nucleotidase
MNKKLHKHPLRILLSNDDGIHAPGLKVLERIAKKLSHDVWVVAPETEQSGAAHSLTLRRPLRIRRISPKVYTVDGTPTDCIMLGISHIMKDHSPDLVLSGVNLGSNLGEDVTYSGTVAAAMEATLLGVPAIALSQASTHLHPTYWSTAEKHAPGLIQRLIQIGWPKNVLVNINFPDIKPHEVKGIQIVKQGLRSVRETLTEWRDPRGAPYYWIGGKIRDNTPTEVETDLEAVNLGAIAVTPLHLDLTHSATLRNLKQAFV